MWYRYSIASNCPQTRFVARADHVTQRRGNPCGCPYFCNGDRRASGGRAPTRGAPTTMTIPNRWICRKPNRCSQPHQKPTLTKPACSKQAGALNAFRFKRIRFVLYCAPIHHFKSIIRRVWLNIGLTEPVFRPQTAAFPTADTLSTNSATASKSGQVQEYYNLTAEPFNWHFTRQDLEERMQRVRLAA